MNGLPFATINLTSGTPAGLGNWTLTAQSADVKNIAVSLQNPATSDGTHNHLNVAVIDDIVMVCHYSAK